MTGSETKNFDLVIEFAESAFNELLYALFQAPIETLCDLIPGAPDDCSILAPTVSFDRPTGFTPLPPANQDVIDVRIAVGPSGNIGTVRIVVGLDIVHNTNGHDDLVLNFAAKTYHASATGLLAAIVNLKTRVEGFGAIKLLSPAVNRASANPRDLTAFDLKVIDDTGAGDLDAAAFLLMYGGGGPGRRNDFTRSFVPPGGRGAIAIFFGWLCRILDAALNSSFGDPTAFSNCTLQHPIVVDAGQEVSLTQFSMTLRDGFIDIQARVEKSGFCYTARGDMSARLQFEIRDGRLLAGVTLGAPTVNIDVPWYCWLGLAFLGFVIGALGGLLTAIIGAILAPLLLSITTDTVENVINRVLSDLTDRVNALVPEVDVPAAIVNIVFQRVFLDDITVVFDVAVDDHAPVKAEGVLTIPTGMYADLDTGTVGGADLPGADLGWLGNLLDLRLATVCDAGVARTGSRDFASFSRHRLWRFVYESPATVPLNELATIDPFGVFTGDLFRETGSVFGVKTDDDRYGVVRALEVSPDFVRLQYKTYDKSVPSVKIVGDFECTHSDEVAPAADLVFVPSASRVANLAHAAGAAAAPAKADPCATIRAQVMPLVDRAVAEPSMYSNVPLDEQRIGTWSHESLADTAEVGRFHAAANGLHGPLEYSWEVAGAKVKDGTGRITVAGTRMNYELSGANLALRWSRETPAQFEIQVTVSEEGDCANSASTKRCIDYTPDCPVTKRVNAPWAVYQAAYMENFGVVEVALPAGKGAPVLTVAPSQGGRATTTNLTRAPAASRKRPVRKAKR